MLDAQLDPGNAAAFNNRGVLHKQQGKPDLALKDYNEAIRLNPRYAKAFSNRGVLHQQQSRPDPALKDYNEAIRLNPRCAKAFYNRGNLHKQQSRPDLALKDYNEAIRLNPRYATAFYNRGNLYGQQDRFDSEFIDHHEAIRLDPRIINSISKTRAMMYRGRSNFDPAAAAQAEPFPDTAEILLPGFRLLTNAILRRRGKMNVIIINDSDPRCGTFPKRCQSIVRYRSGT